MNYLMLFVLATTCHAQYQTTLNFADGDHVQSGGAVNLVTKPGCEAYVEGGNITVSPTKLQCGKYQHIQHTEGYCHWPACKEGVACPAIAVCDSPSDTCVDDMREVTEREWQELMKRIKSLESKEK
jgi:hypothetical protein